jgi:hypothetical protein
LRDDVGVDFHKVTLILPLFFILFILTTIFNYIQVWLDSDGGKAHFKSRISFYFASTLPSLFGMVFMRKFGFLLEMFLTLVFFITDIRMHWIFSPSNHGKGDCDSHGAVVKTGAKLFVLNGK